MPKYWIDGRSIGMPRTTGWERYARGLLTGLDEQFSVGHRSTRNPLSALVLGLHQPTGFDAYHYPTYPPGLLQSYKNVSFTIMDLTWWLTPDASSKLGSAVYRRLAERAVQNGARISTISEASRTAIAQHFNILSSKIPVISPGFTELSQTEMTFPTYPPRDKPYLLAVGTIEPRKDYGTLIAAFEKSSIAESHDLLIAGRPGWGTSVPSEYLVDSPTDAQLSNLYRGATAVVNTSLHEGFGLPVLEAMKYGVPVICSDIPAYREVAGDLGIYFQVGDSDALAQKLDTLASVEFNRQALEARANLFTWRESQKALTAVLADLVTNSQNPQN